ncbi:neuronal acetylcholine receptor subunit alpha-7-like isoform X4 [Micropterus dolomieu]|uniref:neuronal acetylcholine receptor subunit alpha-7-like isoform X4 n=1 Tax=Micropterus dolomieu TaxID=147949 RepID=UPI001E8E7004|nr:neuronal acetylcholine receptor subunit alpha-7-like isoform X4 [Micropterus dolomieu]XP_045900116.1 neuronal acetylcholine receptor subunit alpha-7-like isoform X4 [Micropterus dolomieu]XP_045900117.1 neuronal acetylcholine receptor subunit alpha-7-like isoform X4 [Micropterus dolomieu]
MWQAGALWLLIIATLLRVSVQGPHQRFLLRELLRDYNPMERPVANDSQALTVHFSFTLMQVMDVDEKNQIITTNAWLQMQWYDHYLQWNQSEYPGVKNLRFTPDQVWTPDILLYNSAHDKFDATYKTNVLVNSSGFCEYLPPGIFISTCNVDVRWFPFDIQRCELKFGSWTFDGWLLDIQMKEADVSGYMPNGEWDLVEVPGGRHEVFYDCCAEPYPDVTFVVTLRRRTLFYALNLLIPCVLLSSMTLLVFLLPANSGEKISLGFLFFFFATHSLLHGVLCLPPGITVLLSLTVFMLMVAEIMPATSDSVPLIGQYFASTMVIVAMSVVATVIVLQFHHHNPNSGHMPRWVHLVLLQWVPWFLRMKRPGEAAEPTFSNNQGDSQGKTLSSPTTTTTTITIPTPVNSNLPQSLTSLQASLAQLNHPLSHSLPHRPNSQAVMLPNPIHRDPSLNPHPQPNGHLLYMGFQTFQTTAELEPVQSSRTTSHGRVNSGLGGEEGEGAAGPAGDTPVHQHLPSSKFGSTAHETPLSPDPDASTTTSGPCVLEAMTGGGRSAAIHTHSGMIRSVSVDNQLQALLGEVQFLVERVREQDRQLSLAEQWQFAAAVIDRLFLVGFSVFNIICTIAILMAAPNFGEALSKDFL